MSPKELARKWFESVWNRKDPFAIEEMMDPAAVGTTEAGEVIGPAAFRTAVFDPLTLAFPDLNVEIIDSIEEGNQVAVRWKASATHAGLFVDLAPSGKRVSFSGMTLLSFKDGRIVSGSDSYNFHGLIAVLSGGPSCASVCFE